MIKLAVSGCLGRMGQRITSLAIEDKDFELASLLERLDHPDLSKNPFPVEINTDCSLKGSDVVIEFTSPEATMSRLETCVANNVKMVIGTTGLSDEQVKKIEEASKKIGIVYSANMSVGVNILFKLAQELSSKTDQTYTARITEAHHIHKKDAPSGTAKTLAKIVEEAGNREMDDVKSIREGEIIGDHDVILESPVDTITISHHAKTRDIFAKGSLIAAKFIAQKENGMFNMQNVLGLI